MPVRCWSHRGKSLLAVTGSPKRGTWKQQRKADQVAKVGRPARRDWVWDPPSRPLGRPAVVPCSPFGRWHPKWREGELGCLPATASWLNTFRPLLKVYRPGRPLAALPPGRVHGTVKALWVQCRGRCHHGPAGRGGQQRQRDPVPRGRASRSPPPQEWDAASSPLAASSSPPTPSWHGGGPTPPPRPEPPPSPACRAQGCPQVRPAAAAAGGACPVGGLRAAILRGTRRPPPGSGVRDGACSWVSSGEEEEVAAPPALPSPARPCSGPTPSPGSRRSAPAGGSEEGRRGGAGCCPPLGRVARRGDRRCGLGEGGEGAESGAGAPGEALPSWALGSRPRLPAGRSPGSGERSWGRRAGRLRDSDSDEPPGLPGSSPSLLDSFVCVKQSVYSVRPVRPGAWGDTAVGCFGEACVRVGG